MQAKLIKPEELELPHAFSLPKRKDWRIGIIGFGDFAQEAHVPDYQEVGWSVAAVAVRNAERQQIAKARFGIERVYSDYRDLIEDEEVEVIDLLTQPNLREEVVLAAARAGKPIIVEKPLGTTAAECRRMVDAANRSKIALAVHQNYRWMKGNFLAGQIVKAGWIGTPFFVSIEKFGKQDTDRAHHPIYSQCDDYLTLHWNTHFVDLLRFWTGRDARRVAAHSARMEGQNFKSDNLLISLHDLGPGLTGHILHSELLRSSLADNQCRIDADGGSIVFDFSGESILLESHKLGEGVYLLDTSKLKWGHALCGSMGDFLLSIEEQREPEVSGQMNLPTIDTVFAEMASIKLGGKWVPVNN